MMTSNTQNSGHFQVMQVLFYSYRSAKNLYLLDRIEFYGCSSYSPIWFSVVWDEDICLWVFGEAVCTGMVKVPCVHWIGWSVSKISTSQVKCPTAMCT